MAWKRRAWVLGLLVGCASDDPSPAFFAAPLDAQVGQSDAAIRDASAAVGMDAAVALGPEGGRLAGFTAAHNAARARVPTSSPLPPLVWSSEIAVVAQAYANQLAQGCAGTLAHSDSTVRHGWGENLASFGIMGSNQTNGSAQDTVDLWESELGCYTFGPFASGTNATCSAECAQYGGCGHYTQMVWRATQRVGCGEAECKSADGWRRSYWVCNYDPPGNFRGQLPY